MKEKLVEENEELKEYSNKRIVEFERGIKERMSRNDDIVDQIMVEMQKDHKKRTDVDGEINQLRKEAKTMREDVQTELESIKLVIKRKFTRFGTNAGFNETREQAIIQRGISMKEKEIRQDELLDSARVTHEQMVVDEEKHQIALEHHETVKM